MKKYFFILTYWLGGGTEKVFENIAKVLSENNLVYLFVINGFDKEKYTLESNVKLLENKRMLRKHITKNSVIVNFSGDWKSSLASAFLSKKIISWIHCNPHTMHGARTGLLNFWLLKRSERIVCVCNEQKEILQNEFGFKNDFTVIYNSVDFDSVREKANEKLNVKYKYFLMVARIDFNSKDFFTVIDVILSGCEFKTNVYKNSFWYSGEVLNIGTPRADVFFNEEKILQNKKKVLDFYNLEDDAKILMYAPTFRQSHNLDIYNLDYSKLESVLVHKFGGKWKIIVRLHPNIAHLADELWLPNTVLNVTSYKDMQELLCASDIVITDYSGLMFDFYIMNRPLFLFCTDFNEYTSKDRDLYFDFKELPFDLAKSNGELCDRIKEFDYQKYLSNVEIFRKKIGFCEAGYSCIEIIKYIGK